jgi:hypothetical protein
MIRPRTRTANGATSSPTRSSLEAIERKSVSAYKWARELLSRERKARDSNPHSPGGNRVSSAARPTVSGYLPVTSMREVVDHRGVEPRSPGCKPGVFPLDQQPMSVDHRQRSARESNSVPLLTGKGCRRRTRGPSCFILDVTESSRRESNPRFLFVKEVSSPLDHGTANSVPRRVARVGFEPTDIRLSV